MTMRTNFYKFFVNSRTISIKIGKIGGLFHEIAADSSITKQALSPMVNETANVSRQKILF